MLIVYKYLERQIPWFELAYFLRLELASVDEGSGQGDRNSPLFCATRTFGSLQTLQFDGVIPEV